MQALAKVREANLLVGAAWKSKPTKMEDFSAHFAAQWLITIA
jgi:hypothetical protein